MISAIFATAARLDRWLQDTLGEPYRTVIGIGLLIEIVQRLREFPGLVHSGKSPIGEGLALLLFAALLLNQLAEFHERMVARRERRAGRSRS
jgi:hypothetical protein